MWAFRKIKILLKSIDSFGQPILLSYKGKTEYRTWFGGILSIILFATIIIFSLDAITSLLLRENIAVALSTVYEKDPYSIELSGNAGFYLAVGLYPDVFNNITSRHFNIYAEQRVYKRYSNGSEEKEFIPLELNPCQKDNFPEDYNYIKYNQTNWLCLRKNQSLLFEGNFQSDIYRHVKIGVDRCRNRTGFNICAPSDETEYLIKNNKIYLNTIFSNKLINLQEYHQPVSDFMEASLSLLLDPAKYYKQADVFMRHNTILIDDDIWMYNKKKRVEVTFESFREQVMDVNSDRYAALFFQSSSNRGVYDAKVEKLTTMLGRLGGLISVLFSVIEIIARFYNRKKLLVSLANFLYNFIIPSSDSRKLTPNSYPDRELELVHKEEIKAGDTSSSSTEKLFFRLRRPIENLGNNSKNEKIRHFDKILVDGEHPKMEKNCWNGRLTMSIKSYLSQFSKIDLTWKTFPFFFCKTGRRLKISQRGELFDKAIQKIDRDLDIIQILETVKGVEKLKEFLFNEHQRVLFEFFPKPVISISSFDLNKVIKPSRKSQIRKRMTDAKRILRNEYLMNMINKRDRTIDEEAFLYLELYKAFKTSTQDPTERMDRNNQKLVSFLGQNLVDIFKNTEEI